MTRSHFSFRRRFVAHTVGMPNKTFLVRLRSDAIQYVRAATVEIHGEHLVFLTAEGKLAAFVRVFDCRELD